MSTSASELFSNPTVGPASPTAQDWLRMAWRHRWLILGSTVIVGALTIGFISVLVPSYATTAKVWVQTEQQGTPSFLSGIAAYRESQFPDPVNRKIETEMELMQTRSIAREVIQRLHVTEAQLARSPMDQIMAKLRPFLPSSGDADKGPPQLEDQFLKSLSVMPLRSGTADTTSNVLEVRFECADAELAPKALQAVLDNYLRMGAQQNWLLGEATARLVESKMNDARKELSDVEAQMLKLSLNQQGREVNLPAPARAEPRTTLPGSGLPGSANGALRIDMGLDLSGAGHAQAMAQLKTQTLDLQAQLEGLRQLYTEDAENVRGVRQRLADAQGRLRSGIAAGVRADAEMGLLDRARSMAQDRFVELRRKLDQIELYLQLNPTESASRSVIDAPQVPKKPERSKRSLMLILGMVAGLMLGLLLAGVREMFDRRLHTVDDLRRQLDLPVLGGLPRLAPSDKEQLDAALS